MGRKLNLEGPKEEVKPKPAMSKEDFLAAVTGTTAPKAPAKSKDKIPTLTPASDVVRKAVDEVVELKQTLKETKAALETDEAAIIDFVLNEKENDSIFTKSYRVQGLNNLVTVVTADKFSNFMADDESALQNLLGDKFGEFVEKEIKMTVRPEVFSNPKLMEEFIALMPNPEAINKFFVNAVTLKPTEGMDQKLFRMSKEDKAKYDSLKPYVKQAKPSVKA